MKIERLIAVMMLAVLMLPVVDRLHHRQIIQWCCRRLMGRPGM